MQRFKSILIGMLAVAFVGTVVGCKEEAVAASTDWKKSEHNWNVEWNQSGYDVGLNVRNQYRSDYDHVELSVNFQSLTMAVRAAEEDGAASWSQIQVSQQIEQQYSPPYTRTNRNSSSVLAPTAADTAPSTEPAPTSDGATLLRLPRPTTRQSPTQPRPAVPSRFAAR